jgi:hypothetical protein
MSLMKINHTINEIKKLSAVIENLIKNYDTDFQKFDSEYEKVNDSIQKRLDEADKKNDKHTFADIIEEENCYINPIEDLKTLAQYQNELILVKHVALIERMIIVMFQNIIEIMNDQDCRDQYFEANTHFTDVCKAVNEISKLTNKEINIKKLPFWYFYETMITIRHSIAHGEPLFQMSYKRIKKFNEKIDIINVYSEINQNYSTGSPYPSLPNPTNSDTSNWYCHLSNEITNLSALNNKFFDFVQEIREQYIMWGKNNNISNHDLYAKSRLDKHP